MYKWKKEENRFKCFLLSIDTFTIIIKEEIWDIELGVMKLVLIRGIIEKRLLILYYIEKKNESFIWGQSFFLFTNNLIILIQ